MGAAKPTHKSAISLAARSAAFLLTAILSTVSPANGFKETPDRLAGVDVPVLKSNQSLG